MALHLNLDLLEDLLGPDRLERRSEFWRRMYEDLAFAIRPSLDEEQRVALARAVDVFTGTGDEDDLRRRSEAMLKRCMEASARHDYRTDALNRIVWIATRESMPRDDFLESLGWFLELAERAGAFDDEVRRIVVRYIPEAAFAYVDEKGWETTSDAAQQRPQSRG